ncbi:MAG: lytic transglycosylase domain-containing protein [Flavobacteriales bacterium]|nr:lytic transglycosylase domain-containing protein [Flavobacteriales bacterium]MCB9192036.1 lytic transglycosylase domain-containing protein [Flavobacteriales bacterium]
MMSKASYQTLTGILLGVVILMGYELFTFSSDDHKTEDQNYQHKFNEDYRIYSLNIPTDLTFCEEEVPLYDMDVYERLDRELLVNTYWQSNSLLYHKRASKWFPIMEPILKKNGVPDDFKYLCLIESGLMNVVSPAGATGFWQILKTTGQEYGLEINSNVDERYDVAKSTEAACKYLKEAHDKYGNWTLAAASYNMGINGVERQLERQKVNNYYDLLLNAETSRYVFRIIAAKEILEHPTKYGFHFRLKDLYLPPETYTVKVDTAISDLALFAEQHGVNYKILKIFNPWLRETHLNNKSRKLYTIEFPKSGYFDFQSTEVEPDSNEVAPKESLSIPEGDE